MRGMMKIKQTSSSHLGVISRNLPDEYVKDLERVSAVEGGR